MSDRGMLRLSAISLGLGYTARYAGDFMNPVIVGPLTVAVGAVFLAGAAVDLLFRRNLRTVSA